jgi:peptidyl-prolyl cis-trans isomerase D
MRYLLIFFLGIVCFGMIITLAPIPTGDSSRMETSALAEIHGASISTQDLYRTIQSRVRNMPAGYGSRLVPIFAKPVLDEMILQRAVAGQAAKLGIEVSDDELRRALQAIPWLYTDGSFLGTEAYESIIQQQTGMTVPQFEAELRNGILLDKIRDVITDGIQVTPAEVRAEFLRRNARAKIEYVLFDPSQYLKAVEINDPSLEAFYKKAPERYKVPEQRRVRYVLIEADRLRPQIKVSESEVRQYYSQHISDYRVQDRVQVAHILFKTMGKKPDELATIEKTARDVLAQVKSGADFSELAKKYSEDSSASKGGEIGWIVRGQTVKQFEDTAFSMKPGEVSDLIKTTYGIHIIKVLDKQSAHLQTVEEVKGKIQAELENQKLAAAQQSQGGELERKVKANPNAFETLARQAGFESKETALFRYNQAVPDLGNSETFHNLAFQLRVGQVGTPFTVPKGLAIIQVLEIVPEHVPKLEEVRARVEQDYRAEQSKVVAAQKAKEFTASLKTGDLKKLAQAAHLEVKESKDFTRQDNIEGLGSGSQIEAAFTLNPGQTSDVVPVGQNNVVFRVISHTPASETEFAAQRDRIAEELLSEKRNLAFEIYRQNLKQVLLRSGELKINDRAMKHFLAAYQKP